MKTKTCGECKFHCASENFCTRHRIPWLKESNKACKGFEPQLITNGDVLRQMTDEELVDRIYCPYENCISEFVEDVDCRSCKMHWLNAPAESCVAENGKNAKQTDSCCNYDTESEGKMSNDYKACPFVKELCLQGENGEPRKTVGWLCSAICDKCPARNPLRHGYNSVFNQITQSPEVLAEKLVYRIYDVDGHEWWTSTLCDYTQWELKTGAIAATVKKLKEVEE